MPQAASRAGVSSSWVHPLAGRPHPSVSTLDSREPDGCLDPEVVRGGAVNTRGGAPAPLISSTV